MMSMTFNNNTIAMLLFEQSKALTLGYRVPVVRPYRQLSLPSPLRLRNQR